MFSGPMFSSAARPFLELRDGSSVRPLPWKNFRQALRFFFFWPSRCQTQKRAVPCSGLHMSSYFPSPPSCHYSFPPSSLLFPPFPGCFFFSERSSAFITAFPGDVVIKRGNFGDCFLFRQNRPVYFYHGSARRLLALSSDYFFQGWAFLLNPPSS